MAEIEFKKLERKDGADFCRFLAEVFGESPSFVPAFYEHLHFDNPAGESIAYGAWDAGRLVGSNILQKHRFRTGGATETWCHSISAATHPDYRTLLLREDGKIESIFTKLNAICRCDAVREGLPVTYAFPNEHSYSGVVRHMRFVDIGTVPILLDVFRPGEAMSLKLAKIPPFLCKLAMLLPDCALTMRDLLRPRHGGDFRITAVDRVDGEWDRLSEEAAGHYPIMQDRGRDFLRWRFFDHPQGEYRLLEARKDGRLRAYLVYTVRPWPDRESRNVLCAYVADFLAMPDTEGEKALYALLRRARRDFVSEKAVLSTAIQNVPERFAPVFAKAGYFIAPKRISPRPMRFTVRQNMEDDRPKGELPENLKHLDRWYLTLADNDIC